MGSDLYCTFTTARSSGPRSGRAIAKPKADLNQLIDLSVETDKPILIVEDGMPVGMLTKRNLLRGIHGEKDNG